METMISVSAGHIIHVLRPTQPVGSGRPWGSNPRPPDQESFALPSELPRERDTEREREKERERERERERESDR